ncbi:SOS response-associated peptidase [Candidatus Poribacteria bacterium]|nr:SOS response-associated peptidase [Candidatus Poribacteria bacterium]
MCGRFTLFDSDAILSKAFGVPISFDLTPRYNVAPSQPILTVRVSPETGKREFAWLRWGLVPHWAQDPSIGNRMINARGETVAEKPAFRDAFQRRRCLVPASGFFEWKKGERRKQPYYIRMKDGRLFVFAGLWDLWKGPDGSPVESCTLITTDANNVVAQLHDRMPVIMPHAAYDLWLGTEIQERGHLLSLLHPYPAEEMEAYPVGFFVNDPKTEDLRCIARLQE